MSYLTYNDFYSGIKDQNSQIMNYGDICYATLFNKTTGKEVGTLDVKHSSVLKYFWLTSGCTDKYWKKIQIQLIPGSANEHDIDDGPWSKRMYTPVQTTDFFFMNVGIKDIINEIEPENGRVSDNYTGDFVLNNGYPWICNKFYDHKNCTGFMNWKTGKIQLLDTDDERIVSDIKYEKYYYIRHNDNEGHIYDWRMNDKCGELHYKGSNTLVIKFTYISGPVKDYIEEINIGRKLCKQGVGPSDYGDLVTYNFLLKGGIGKDYTKQFVSKKLQIIDEKKKYYQITTEAVPSYKQITQNFKKCGYEGIDSEVKLGSIIYDDWDLSSPAGACSGPLCRRYDNPRVNNKYIDGKLSQITNRVTCPDLRIRKMTDDKILSLINGNGNYINICGEVDFDVTLPWSSDYNLQYPFTGPNGMFQRITFAEPSLNSSGIDQGTLTLDLLLTDMDECMDLIKYFNYNPKDLDNNVIKACILGCLSTNVGNNYVELLYGKIPKEYEDDKKGIRQIFNEMFDVPISYGEKTINDSFINFLDYKELKDNENFSVSIFFNETYKNFFDYLCDVIRPIYFNDDGTQVYILDPSFYNKTWDNMNIQDLVRRLCRDTKFEVELKDEYQGVPLKNLNKVSKNILYSGWDLSSNETYIKNDKIDNENGKNVSLARYIKIEIESWSLGLYAFYMRMKGIKPAPNTGIDEKLFDHTKYSTYDLFKKILIKAEKKGGDFADKKDFSEQIYEVCDKVDPCDISEFPDSYSSFLFGDNDRGQPVILAKKNQGKYDKNLGLCQCANSQFKADAPHLLNELLQTNCFSQGCESLSDVYDDKTCGDTEVCRTINGLFIDSDCTKRTLFYDDFNKVKYDALCGKDFPIVYRKKNQRTIEMVTIILCVSLSLLILLLVKGNWIVKGVIAGGTVTILVLISKIIIRSIKTDDCGNPIEPAQ